MVVRARNPWISFFLTFFFPGLGQLYNGQFAKAIILLCISILIPCFFGLTNLMTYPLGFVVSLLLSILFLLYRCIDAVIVSKSKPEYILKKFNTWVVYLGYIILTIGVSLIIDHYQILGIQSFRLPTPSMKSALLIGDRLAAELTDTPEKEIARGNIITFYVPPDQLSGNATLIKDKIPYLMRCIGLPGDNIEIKNGDVLINDRILFNKDVFRSSFVIESNTVLNKKTLEKLELSSEDFMMEERVSDDQINYIMWITSEKAEELENLSFIGSVSPQEHTSGGIFPFTYYNKHSTDFDNDLGWTLDDFGPLWIPKKDETIAINDSTLLLFGDIITEYEHHSNAQIINKKLIINNKEVLSYTFKQNYYFVLGDNRHNALDSRYWGFVPEDHIFGKALFIWLSIDPDKNFPNNIRWKRFFKMIE